MFPRALPDMKRQHGLGLVETLLITLLVGGALVAGTLWLQIHTASGQAREQADILRQADRALLGFATAHYRLPCPDTDGDGLEDCSGGAIKGALPWRDLGVEDPALRARIRQLAYMVDRTGADLASAANRFDPGSVGTAEFRTVDDDGLVGHDGGDNEFRVFDNVGTPDLCLGISRAANASAPTVGGAGGSPVAYAIAHPGSRDMDGSGGLFDGENAAAGPVMADPGRAAGSGYDDRVVQRSHGRLSEALNCSSLILSLEGLSLGVSAVDEVHSQQEWLIGSSSVAAAVNAVKMAIAGTKAVIAGGTLGTSITELSAASAALSAAISTCVVIVGCAEIPHAAAWTAAAGVAVGASSAAIIANVAAYGLNLGALITNLTVAVQMGVELDEVDTGLGNGGGIDIDSLVGLDEVNDQLIEARDQAQDELDEREEELDEAFDERQDACRCGDAGQCRNYYDNWGWGLDAFLDDEMRSIMNEVSNKADDTDADVDLVDELRGDAADNLEAQQALEQAIDDRDRAERDEDFGDDAGGADDALGSARDEVEAELESRIDEVNERIDGLPGDPADTEEGQRLLEERQTLQETLDDLGSTTSGQSSDEQLESIENSIDDIDAEIANVECLLGERDDASCTNGETVDDPDRRQQLNNRLDELEESRRSLFEQKIRIDPDIDELEARIDQAESETERTKEAFEDQRQEVIDAAQGTYEEEVEVCETNADGEQECHTETKTRTVDRTDEMEDAVDDYFQAKAERPGDQPDDADSDFEACFIADREWRLARDGVENARESRDQAQRALDEFSDPSTEEPSGEPPVLWDRTGEILERSDEKGGSL
ncbi:hypothetical protein KBTX_00475 [wastewater metagenome]|uniref:Uncharacterized protein n=3 Tax=root TaxID=1 RepID=A0A5B8R9X4_9ZZZZ|nr:hypothetical protein KBTEX_00475 [uncultured organism]